MRKSLPKMRKNGFQWPWHPYQVCTWALFVIVAIGSVVLFGLVLPAPFNVIFNVVTIALEAAVAVLGLVTTAIDPADDMKEKNFVGGHYCYVCKIKVKEYTEHCNPCNKCVSGFDHHCVWLNNCIGGKNYKLFICTISTLAILSYVLSIVSIIMLILSFIEPALISGFISQISWFPSSLLFYQIVVAAFLIMNLTLLYYMMDLIIFHIQLAIEGNTTYTHFQQHEKEETEERFRKRLPQIKPLQPPGSTQPTTARRSLQLFKQFQNPSSKEPSQPMKPLPNQPGPPPQPTQPPVLTPSTQHSEAEKASEAGKAAVSSHFKELDRLERVVSPLDAKPALSAESPNTVISAESPASPASPSSDLVFIHGKAGKAGKAEKAKSGHERHERHERHGQAFSPNDFHLAIQHSPESMDDRPKIILAMTPTSSFESMTVTSSLEKTSDSLSKDNQDLVMMNELSPLSDSTPFLRGPTESFSSVWMESESDYAPGMNIRTQRRTWDPMNPVSNQSLFSMQASESRIEPWSTSDMRFFNDSSRLNSVDSSMDPRLGDNRPNIVPIRVLSTVIDKSTESEVIIS